MTDQIIVRRNPTRVLIGISIIIAGILFTLDNLRLLHAETYLEYWPILLVVVGVARIIDSRRWPDYAWSLVLLVGGLWLLGENLGIVTVSIWKLSPLLLVLLGASIVWRAFGAPLSPPASDAKPDSYVRGAAIMGGFERTSAAAEFRGGDLIAVMGGGKVDLRNATMAGSEAVIDVVAFMGGVELLIPKTWAVDPHVIPIFGGVGDRSHCDPGAVAHRLVIRGTVFMGGIDIKN